MKLQCCPVDHIYVHPGGEVNWRESSTGLLRWLGAGEPEGGGGTEFAT